MSRKPGQVTNTHKWTQKDFDYIRNTLGEFTLQEYSEHFGVSEYAFRNVLLRNFSKEEQLTIRAVNGRVNYEADDIICPYYTRRMQNGVQCDRQFGVYMPKRNIRAFVRNHCAKYYSDELHHCTMRKMLNFKWGMDV